MEKTIKSKKNLKQNKKLLENSMNFHQIMKFRINKWIWNEKVRTFKRYRQRLKKLEIESFLIGKKLTELQPNLENKHSFILNQILRQILREI
jgi:hypothetical protein